MLVIYKDIIIGVHPNFEYQLAKKLKELKVIVEKVDTYDAVVKDFNLQQIYVYCTVDEQTYDKLVDYLRNDFEGRASIRRQKYLNKI